MAGFVKDREVEILDHYFGGSTMPAPEATLKFDLLTTMPTDDDGTGLVKPSYAGYAQLSVTNNATNFPASTAGDPTVKSNGILFSFGQKTDVGSITVVGWVCYKNDGTTIVQFGSTLPNAVISQNQTPEYQIGDLTFKAGDEGDSY